MAAAPAVRFAALFACFPGFHARDANAGFDYQKYMTQYSGNHAGKTGNASGSSSGQDYQKYMQQYADKYMSKGGNSSGSSSAQGYQQYMKQYADKYMSSQGGNSSGADYQKYMNDYASKYMHYAGKSTAHGKKGSDAKSGSSAQDYQKYMHQYAAKYMGGASANLTELNAVKQSKSNDASVGQDYQQYMQQYAGKYMGGGQGAGGAGQNYQTYMHQYADKYTGAGGSQNHTGAGQDYQQYMHQYAGKYVGQQQGAGAGTAGWQSYMQQYSRGHGGQQAGEHVNYTHVEDLKESLNKHNPANCTTWQCLCTWRKDQVSVFEATVPAMYSSFAVSNAEQQYKDLLTALAKKTSTTVDKLGLSAACDPNEAPATALAAASKASTATVASGASTASVSSGESLVAQAAEPRSGMVILFVLMGLSLPAVASLVGSVLRRRGTDVRTLEDAEGAYYEAIA